MRTHLRAAVWLSGLWLLSGTARALPGPALHGISLGQALSDAQQALAANTQGAPALTVLSASTSQGYADGLLRSDFLAALNRAGAKQSLLRDPAHRKIEFLQGQVGNSRTLLGFAEGVLEAAFVKVTIKPDEAVGGGDNAFTRARLAPLHQFLASLRGAGCRLQSVPEGRNAFVNHGTCGDASIYVEYRPETDEFWVVYWNAGE